mmetsp:Transcript_1121/g.4760  ORF Transcript_1121/g.4760 Transcript_1121/m.4760 type:complete len:561 (+) Transcript_1121:114-1796(+)
MGQREGRSSGDPWSQAAVAASSRPPQDPAEDDVRPHLGGHVLSWAAAAGQEDADREQRERGLGGREESPAGRRCQPQGGQRPHQERQGGRAGQGSGRGRHARPDVHQVHERRAHFADGSRGGAAGRQAETGCGREGAGRRRSAHRRAACGSAGSGKDHCMWQAGQVLQGGREGAEERPPGGVRRLPPRGHQAAGDSRRAGRGGCVHGGHGGESRGHRLECLPEGQAGGLRHAHRGYGRSAGHRRRPHGRAPRHQGCARAGRDAACRRCHDGSGGGHAHGALRLGGEHHGRHPYEARRRHPWWGSAERERDQRKADQVRGGGREDGRAGALLSRPHGQPHSRHGRCRDAGREAREGGVREAGGADGEQDAGPDLRLRRLPAADEDGLQHGQHGRRAQDAARHGGPAQQRPAPNGREAHGPGGRAHPVHDAEGAEDAGSADSGSIGKGPPDSHRNRLGPVARRGLAVHQRVPADALHDEQHGQEHDGQRRSRRHGHAWPGAFPGDGGRESRHETSDEEEGEEGRHEEFWVRSEFRPAQEGKKAQEVILLQRRFPLASVFGCP